LIRDVELFRHILIEIEKQPPGMRGHKIDIPGHSAEEVYEHARLTQDAGLIEAVFHKSMPTFVVRRLTNDGHDFLAAARQETIWAEAKATVRNSIGTITIAALKTVLNELVQRAVTGRI
jgi:DNA-binding HxlR family transcriptional regulator